MKPVLVVAAIAMSIQVGASESKVHLLDWSKDRFLIGTWECDLARPGKALAQERAIYSFGLNDQWLKLAYTLTPGVPDEANVSTEAYEAFDPKLNLWAYTSFGSDGNYGTAYSHGWVGKSKTYGPLAGSKDPWRLVQTQLDHDHFIEVVDIGKVGGSWERVSELRCRRST